MEEIKDNIITEDIEKMVFEELKQRDEVDKEILNDNALKKSKMINNVFGWIFTAVLSRFEIEMDIRFKWNGKLLKAISLVFPPKKK